MGTMELTAPALVELGFLVGDWEMTISNAPFLGDPDQVVAGTVEIEPIEAGRLLAIRQIGDPTGPLLASWVVGRDGSVSTYTVLYTDDRGVLRVYGMRASDNTWTIHRDDPEFSQRFEAVIAPDRDSLDGHWEKRSGAGPWEHDFDISYTRRRGPRGGPVD